MALINLGGVLVPPPAGVDMSTMDTVRASLPLLAPRHFVFPWLAHGLGTLLGAYLAARLAVSRKLASSLAIGGLFFAGGSVMVKLVGGPSWFIAADLLLAYFPMAYLGFLLASSLKPKSD